MNINQFNQSVFDPITYSITKSMVLDILSKVLPDNDYISISFKLCRDQPICIPIQITHNSVEFYPNSTIQETNMDLSWEYKNHTQDINIHPVEGMYTKRQFLSMIQHVPSDEFKCSNVSLQTEQYSDVNHAPAFIIPKPNKTEGYVNVRYFIKI